MAKKTKKEKKADLEKDKAQWEKHRVPMKDIPTYDASRESPDMEADLALATMRSIPKPVKPIPPSSEKLPSWWNEVPTYDARLENPDFETDLALATLRSIPTPDLKKQDKEQIKPQHTKQPPKQ